MKELTAREFWKQKFGEYPQTDSDKLACAMMAEFAQQVNQPVQVKGLEWVDNGSGHHIAKTSLGEYAIDTTDIYFWLEYLDGGSTEFETLQEAKEQAQSHFNSLISQSLESVSQDQESETQPDLRITDGAESKEQVQSERHEE